MLISRFPRIVCFNSIRSPTRIRVLVNAVRCQSTESSVDAIESVAEPILNAAGEVSLQTLGLGSHYTPVGWVQCFLEYLHADCGLDWCPSIAACAFLFRLALFPIVIKSQQTAARMRVYMPRVVELQDQIKQARIRGDNIETINLTVEMMDFLKKNQIKPFQSALFSMIQIPVFVSTFLAIRNLCKFPLDSMLDGGMLWFPNLYENDPYLALPFITCCTMMATIEVGFRNGATPVQPSAKLALRVLPIISLPILSRFSCGLVFYWSVTNLISLSQVGLLSFAPLRRLCNIPDVKQPLLDARKKKHFLQDLKESWTSNKLLSEVEDRKRLDERRFKEAGLNALMPTYRTNPMAQKKEDVKKD